ncbi:uncharacterized protein BT62DRAFT_1009870 [Guyanagaster necrorhizus]|uniref:Uncharacterized protein n=1 Tax=Guyanagaster necrorhizus TaxID=856835 RepID=A0A9P7VLS6_9AGAR|nr:uncharacterized protein BT62DRAFT_1009870 [Guyanagaster necrorhizus MCA 3950]KAG7442870.1 hypothetical protein BT62DRAFT_1009870 [Guyanagaster necrorhizus MCA 3950]
MAPRRRLHQLLDGLASLLESIGMSKLGTMEYESKSLLDIRDPTNADNLHFMLQKYLLGQDVFRCRSPVLMLDDWHLPLQRYQSSATSLFVLTPSSSLINSEYEDIALNRDVDETGLKQGREIKERRNLVYVVSPAVNAAKHGRLLILG